MKSMEAAGMKRNVFEQVGDTVGRVSVVVSRLDDVTRRLVGASPVGATMIGGCGPAVKMDDKLPSGLFK